MSAQEGHLQVLQTFSLFLALVTQFLTHAAQSPNALSLSVKNICKQILQRTQSLMFLPGRTLLEADLLSAPGSRRCHNCRKL